MHNRMTKIFHLRPYQKNASYFNINMLFNCFFDFFSTPSESSLYETLLKPEVANKATIQPAIKPSDFQLRHEPKKIGSENPSQAVDDQSLDFLRIKIFNKD